MTERQQCSGPGWWQRNSLLSRLICCIAGILLALGLHLTAVAHAQPDAGDASVCERVAQDAEHAYGVPAGMLLAIGRVESRSWPWTANIDGAAEVYQSRTEAIEALTRVRSPHPVDVDVGCFQISMRYHPMAFASVAEALDPAANANYAARFLRDLHDRLGEWTRAAGAYHSATEPLEAAYRDQVMALWKDAPQAAPADAIVAAQPRWQVIAIGVAVQPTVKVWTLSSMPDTTAAGRLPRVITPAR